MVRDKYWDIVKGLGIIAIVIGHTGSPLTPYLYMYHLALFFFVAGHWYKENYSVDPFAYIGSRLRRLWWPMVQYGIAFALLHNLLWKINVYSDVKNVPGITPMKEYTLLDTFNMIKSTLFMQGMEQMAGAMWFIYPLFMSLICFCFIKKLSLLASRGWKRELVVFLGVMVFGLVGLLLIKKKINVEYHLDIAFLALPILYAGFLSKQVWHQVPFKWYLALLAGTLLVFIYKFTGTHVELSQKVIIGPKWFLLASFSGIYFNLFLARIIQLSKVMSRCIAFLGERSFHIMALHFLAFKSINAIYVAFYNKPLYWIAKFPIIDPKWWLLYSAAGLLIPVVLVEIGVKIRKIVPLNFQE